MTLTNPPFTRLDLARAEGSLVKKYPAKQHARNIAKTLPSKDGLIYLESAPTRQLEDSDQFSPFRQRKYFIYLTGSHDMADSVVTYSIEHDQLIMYIPSVDPTQIQWFGPTKSIADCVRAYDVDRVLFITDLSAQLEAFHQTFPSTPFYILHEDHASAIPPSVPKSLIDSVLLQPAMDNARVIKDDFEISLIRKANDISTAGHKAAMKAVRHASNEAELEALFLASCMARLAKPQSYSPIFPSGRNASILHYAKNDEPLKGRQVLLVDAGAEWAGYASDVTRTYPISGKWTKEALSIYKLVEKMQNESVKTMVKGNDWAETNYLAHKIAIKGLLELGILHNGSEAEIMEAGTSKLFFPHGLGHHLGLEVHDVEPHKDTSIGRMRPVDPTVPVSSRFHMAAPRVLQPGMVLTCEPGIYFCEATVRPALVHPVHGKYINPDVLDKYWDVGGVRIEDDYLILEKGNERLTSAPVGEEMLDLINSE